MYRNIRLKEDEIAKIQKAVEEAEKKTSGEIVPMIVSASHDYWWTHFAYAILGWAVGSFWAIQWVEDSWHATTSHLLQTQAFGMLAGALLSFWSPLKRLLIPKRWANYQVDRQCMASFVAQGLTETRDRTGVLIYISRLEHRVEIIADKGIDSKVPKDYWNEEVQKLITGIRRNKSATAMVEVIKDIGNRLAENFPPREDDVNELSNRVQIQHKKDTDRD